MGVSVGGGAVFVGFEVGGAVASWFWLDSPVDGLQATMINNMLIQRNRNETGLFLCSGVVNILPPM